MGQSTEQRNQPLYRIKPTTAKSLSLPPQMENSFVCSPEHSPVQIVQTAAVSVQNQLVSFDWSQKLTQILYFYFLNYNVKIPQDRVLDILSWSLIYTVACMDILPDSSCRV